MTTLTKIVYAPTYDGEAPMEREINEALVGLQSADSINIKDIKLNKISDRLAAIMIIYTIDERH